MDGNPGWVVPRRVFIRLLGLVYLVAFASLWAQIDGLLGAGGLVPVAERLAHAREVLGREAWWRVPSLLWLGAEGAALHGICATGVLLSVGVVAGRAPRFLLAALWALYLSLSSVGDPFLSYQWDSLLLEAGLVAVFLAPSGWRLRDGRWTPVASVALWLERWLLFRLVFLSGFAKLASGDPTWRSLTALEYHHWTQPLPLPLAWWVDRLPDVLHAASAVGVFAIELVFPWLLFGPRPARLVAATGIAFLMVAISATGNYGFFTFLTLVLCLTAIDDDWIAAAIPGVEPPAPSLRRLGTRHHASRASRVVATLLAVFVGTVTGVRFLGSVGLLRDPPGPLAAIVRATAPFRSFNVYGLFAVMTTHRDEIVVEGSRDGTTWHPYRFRWKPGPVDRAPRFAGFHMPRLDWQMWFAALGTRRGTAWFQRFEARLLEGSPAVLGLLAASPFGNEPPRYVRSLRYRYRFAPAGAGSAWWTRELVGPYGPVRSPPPTRRRRSRPRYGRDCRASGGRDERGSRGAR